MDCLEHNCERPAFARGVCRKHYDMQIRAEAKVCNITGCTNPGVRSGGICDVHYRKALMSRTPKCTVSGCDGAVKAHGLCPKHYQRHRVHGATNATRPVDWGAREEHPLYASYQWHRRALPTSMCEEWADDFWAFVDVVGDRPEGCTLRRKDPKLPLGPDNWCWKPSTASSDKAAYARQWRKDNARLARNADLKKQFGIGIVEYEQMEAAQGGVCAICGRMQTGRFGNLAVDHCHTTGKIRGLLCSACNTAIGALGDTYEGVKAAADYLYRNR